MSKHILNLINLLVLTGMIIFTIALGVNNVNSGVYADAHGLDGAKVGWFAPIGVPLFALSVLIILAYGSYVISRFIEK
jgi:hypothetical protein